MGEIREILNERWFWILVGALILIMIAPLIIVWVIIQLPTPFNAIVVISLIFAWGAAAGYKEWLKSKEKELEKS